MNFFSYDKLLLKNEEFFMPKNLMLLSGLREIEIHQHSYISNKNIDNISPLYFNTDKSFSSEQLSGQFYDDNYKESMLSLKSEKRKIIMIDGHVHLNVFHEIFDHENRDKHVDHFKIPFKSFLSEDKNNLNIIHSGFTTDPTTEMMAYFSGIDSNLNKEFLKDLIFDDIVDTMISPVNIYLLSKKEYGALNIDFKSTFENLTNKNYEESCKKTGMDNLSDRTTFEDILKLSYEKQKHSLQPLNQISNLSSLKNKLHSMFNSENNNKSEPKIK